ncbi:OmpH family outer membrane protein [Sulfuriferula nivalis]|uniref:Outer membrane protein chaperone n=1 Tax=Sulfuriferula nivalis TaxID=2675298 RepID=A0A809RR59_9PROT|nr:OmpH family outer membrane protein [Sulfuriferula nivalis]BBP01351.1 outer membrane protein chaperone [Sulfuriferula nivalis]
MNKVVLKQLVVAVSLLVSSVTAMADMKIGFVNTDRVFREAPIALAAQKKLEKEFSGRDADLQKMAKQARDLQAQLEKDGLTMSDADKQRKERDLANLNRDYQRSVREFREDLNVRRNEELVKVQDKARKAIQAYGESEKYDVILEDVIYFSPKIDITDRIIRSLSQ